MLEALFAGFETALTFTNLLFIFAGITLGIIIGVIPGLGSVTAMAVLIPITFYMSPLAAIAFLVGVNKGGTLRMLRIYEWRFQPGRLKSR